MEKRDPYYGNLDYARRSVIGACSGQCPNFLKSVYGWFKGEQIVLFYLIDCPLSEDAIEDLRCISTEVISDFLYLGLEEIWGTKLPPMPDEVFMVDFEKG